MRETGIADKAESMADRVCHLSLGIPATTLCAVRRSSDAVCDGAGAALLRDSPFLGDYPRGQVL